ncbi:Kelch repeat and BTB domain-containing protein 5 [Chelonia mydas]|uniref:Kelch repeat and BTB domain-containing protein 5 n=1 Tax=Chelonia mydas TaxID=8469 RepID=M7ARH0_CHEMY|nr:Kelch repeat and BTB domain-containing protein 5 [Chelonia mydas]
MASAESRGGEVQLQDVSPSVLQSILRYLYTEELVLTAEQAQELFVTASRLQIPPLLETVGRFLAETISLETCLRLYALAHAHRHPALLRAAGRYVSLHFRSLCEHDAFLRLDPGTLIGIIASDGASRACFFLGEDGKVRQEVAIPALPRAIESAGAVCWRGRVYVVGGEDSARWLNTVYYWEPSTAAWTPCREGPAAGERVGWFGCVTLQVPRRRLRALFQGQPTAPAAGGATGRKQLPCRTSAMAPPPVSGKGGLMCPSTAPGSDQGSPLA